jgi:hypothetical protein
MDKDQEERMTKARAIGISMALSVGSWGVSATAAVTPTIEAPHAGIVAPGPIPVSVYVTSPYQLTTVTATLGSVSTVLQCNGTARCTGTLDAAAVPWGTYPLTVQATNALNETGSASVSLRVDRGPQLKWQPVFRVIVQPERLRISADCVDDDPAGCASLKVLLNAVAVATGTGHVEADVPLPNYVGTNVSWSVEATDGAGQVASAGGGITVPSTPWVTEKLSVIGRLLDFDGTRWLATDGTGHVVYLGASLADMSPSTIFQHTDRTVASGTLAEGGALLTDDQKGIWRWNGAAVVSIASADSYQVAGRYLAYHYPLDNNVVLYDLSTEAAIIDTRDLSPFGFNGKYAVAANGSLAWWSRSARITVAWNLAGNVGTYTNPDDSFVADGPIDTDGTNVSLRSNNNRRDQRISLYPTGELLCHADTMSSQQCVMPAMKDAYTAYNDYLTYQDFSNVWLRDPAGVKTKISIFTAPTYPVAVNGRGDVVLTAADHPNRNDTTPTAQYLVKRGSLPIEMPIVPVRWLGGQWYNVTATSILLVDQPGSSAADGGTGGNLDAGDGGVASDGSLVQADASPDAAVGSTEAGVATDAEAGSADARDTTDADTEAGNHPDAAFPVEDAPGDERGTADASTATEAGDSNKDAQSLVDAGDVGLKDSAVSNKEASVADGALGQEASTGGGGDIDGGGCSMSASRRSSRTAWLSVAVFCGAWQLRRRRRETVTARARVQFVELGIVTTATVLWQHGAGAAVQLNVTKPLAGAIVADVVETTVEITSPYQVSTAIASVGSSTVPMTCSGVSPISCSTTLSTASLTRGSKTLSITVTDANAQSATSTVAFIVDRPPAIQFSDFQAAPHLSRLRLSADCNDDDPAGCRSLKVTVNGNLVGNGTSHVDVDAPLPEYVGQTVTWEVLGTDSVGQSATGTDALSLPVTPSFTETLSVTGATIGALGGQRWVAIDKSAHIAYLGASLSDVAPLVMLHDDASKLTLASLTPSGAVFADDQAGKAWFWDGNALHNVSLPGFAVTLAGGFAAFQSIDLNELYVYDMSTQTRVFRVRDSLPFGSAGIFALAANGNLIWSQLGSGAEIYWWHEGSVVKLEQGPQGALGTDGINAFSWLSGSANRTTVYPSAEVIFQGGLSRFHSMPILSNGWMAYGLLRYPDPGIMSLPPQDVWLRAPDGSKTQVSPFAASSVPTAINSQGDVIFKSSEHDFLVPRGAVPIDITPAPGTLDWHDGRWYARTGSSILALTATGTNVDGGSDAGIAPDGSPDGGGNDASIAQDASPDAPLDVSAKDSSNTAGDASPVNDALVVSDADDPRDGSEPPTDDGSTPALADATGQPTADSTVAREAATAIDGAPSSDATPPAPTEKTPSGGCSVASQRAGSGLHGTLFLALASWFVRKRRRPSVGCTGGRVARGSDEHTRDGSTRATGSLLEQSFGEQIARCGRQTNDQLGS